MANLFLDGMGFYDTAGIDEKYTVLSTTDSTWAIAAEGRFGNCLRKTTITGTEFSESGYVEISPLLMQASAWTPTASGIIGFALEVDDLERLRTPGNHHLDTIIRIAQGPGPVLGISLNPDGTFNVYVYRALFSGDGWTYLGSSIQGIRSAIYYSVQVKWNIHNTTGYVVIRVNNVEVFRFDSTVGDGNTGATSYIHGYTNLWTTVRLLDCTTRTNLPTVIRICDLFLGDLTGAVGVFDFLNDPSIDYYTTEAPGAAAAWTSSTGDTNWENVDDVPPDCGTSYNHTVAAGTRDSHTMQDLPPGTDPIAFQVVAQVRKETEGSADIKFSFKPTAGTYFDSPGQGIATVTDCRFILQPYDTNPATGLTATLAELNDAEIGYQKVVL